MLVGLSEVCLTLVELGLPLISAPEPLESLSSPQAIEGTVWLT